eukprot:Platyproteum_vivax@DN3188_c0_g1_i1.p1
MMINEHEVSRNRRRGTLNTIRRYGLVCYEIVLQLVVLVNIAVLIVRWKLYDSCANSINLWLVVSYLLTSVCLVVFRVNLCISNQISPLIIQRNPVFTLMNILFYWILIPLVVAWAIVGMIMFHNTITKTPGCFPDGPYLPILWISLFSTFGIVCALGNILILAFEVLAYVAGTHPNLSAIEGTRTVQPRGRRVVLRRVLRPQHLDLLPHFTVLVEESGKHSFVAEAFLDTEECIQGAENNSADTGCTICMEAWKTGDDVRILTPCHHIFHTSCIDYWLIRNAVCPNCKAAVELPGFGNNGQDLDSTLLPPARTREVQPQEAASGAHLPHHNHQWWAWLGPPTRRVAPSNSAPNPRSRLHWFGPTSRITIQRSQDETVVSSTALLESNSTTTPPA